MDIELVKKFLKYRLGNIIQWSITIGVLGLFSGGGYITNSDGDRVFSYASVLGGAIGVFTISVIGNMLYCVMNSGWDKKKV